MGETGKVEGLSKLYVYWLRAPMLGGQVVYVGSSEVPEQRRRAAELRFNMQLTMKQSNGFTNFDAGYDRETVEIRKHWLTLFNVLPRSTRRGSLGYKHDAASKSRMSISAKARGAPMYATNAAALVNRGKHMTEEAKKNLSAKLKGKPSKLKGTRFTSEHCAKIGEANRRRKTHPGAGKPMPLGTRKVLGVWNEYQAVVAKQKRRESLTKKDKAIIKAWQNRPEPVVKRKDRNKDRVNLLQSGWGHPWRLATLDVATRSTVENY